MSITPVILGLKGTTLNDAERRFFKSCNPLGFILFSRNCQNKAQITSLINELKTITGRDNTPILIDQEGGRVARLKGDEYPKFPPASIFANLANINLEHAKEAVYLNARLIAAELNHLGINFNCAPVADILFAESHEIIGDRSFGNKHDQVIYLAQQMANGLKDGGVVPIIKHIPGHGRATIDSHVDLPIIGAEFSELELNDFAVFKALKNIPWAMTAHIIYASIDKILPATLSKIVIDLIRGQLDYNGIIITDDLSMKALKGEFKERAAQAFKAGCDVALHCNGDMDEMEQVVMGCDANLNDRVKYFIDNILPSYKSLEFNSKLSMERLKELIDWQYI
jgi:beta-N-acetylhexosaminidase